jgi:hypothetical protein
VPSTVHGAKAPVSNPGLEIVLFEQGVVVAVGVDVSSMLPGAAAYDSDLSAELLPLTW